eukprot:gene21453-biopygen7128
MRRRRRRHAVKLREYGGIEENASPQAPQPGKGWGNRKSGAAGAAEEESDKCAQLTTCAPGVGKGTRDSGREPQVVCVVQCSRIVDVLAAVLLPVPAAVPATRLRSISGAGECAGNAFGVDCCVAAAVLRR